MRGIQADCIRASGNFNIRSVVAGYGSVNTIKTPLNPAVRIRLLLFTPSLELGGTERRLERIAQGLDRARFEVCVAWSDRWGVVGDRMQQSGIPVFRLPVRSHNGYTEALATLRDLGPHVFHSFNYRKDAADVSVARDAGVPVILTGRVNLREWDPQGQVQDWELSRNVLTDKITAVSEAVADLCVAVEGVEREKVTVIHSGVEIPGGNCAPSNLRNELPTAAQVIGYVANYRPEKDHRTLLTAFRSVLGEQPETFLICCGLDVSQQKESLRDMVCDLRLENRVKLLDSQAEDVSAIYRSLDLYVHPSSHEGFSNAILEAMAHGLAVVATGVGGTPEAVVEGSTGLLVPPKDPAGLAHAILKLLKDQKCREEFGRAGRERVRQNFSLPAMISSHERFYETFRPMIENSQTASDVTFPIDHSLEAVEGNQADTTVFVTTIGDEQHFSRCTEHLERQSAKRAVEIIDHVAPMSAALQEMIDRCQTPFYVQVDEDMQLFPHAIESLERMIKDAPPSVAIICAYVWDCETQRPIQGVKIYRHEVVKRFPYKDTLSCEIEQIARMKAAGFSITILDGSDRSKCFGTHGGHYTPETAFKRWQRHFQKHQQIGNMKWIEPWPERLLARYIETRDMTHLYAFLGAVSGIAGGVPSDCELDWRQPNLALASLKRYFVADSGKNGE